MNTALKKICERITCGENNLMNNWHWQQGVAMTGLLEAEKVFNDSSCMNYIKAWTDERLSVKYPGYSINTMAPLMSTLELYKKYGGQKYLDICTDFADWCMAQEPRSDLGAFEHTCVDNYCPNQMWADTLFMGVLFLAKFSLFTGRKLYMYEALRQFVLHYKFLKAKNSSLIVHGYYGDDRKQHGVIWGRGNGWFAAGSAMILSLADESYPQYEEIKQNFINFADELVTYQNEDGSFNTVINDPDSYSEMTGTSAFAFALNEGIKHGIISSKYSTNAQKAISAIINNIAGDGTVLNASGGTCIMEDKSDYNAIETCYSPFAQGLSMMALASAAK